MEEGRKTPDRREGKKMPLERFLRKKRCERGVGGGKDTNRGEEAQ